MSTQPLARADLAAALAERVAGAVVAPDHPGYDAARSVWNAMIEPARSGA